MIRITQEALDELVGAIVREVDPEQVILFGSRARYEAGEESDIDLLIVESAPFGPGRSRWHELERLWPVVARSRLTADILVYSRNEIDRWRGTKNHVINRALLEGRILYERR